MKKFLVVLKLCIVFCQLGYSSDVDSELISELEFFENYQFIKDQEVFAPVLGSQDEELYLIDSENNTKQEVVK